MLPKIIFDTSAINALEERGAASAPLMRRLAWEYEVILTGINLEELIATKSADKRKALICRFERLLRPGRCIVPSGEVLRRMIASHVKAPAQFDWMKVDVRMPQGFENMLARRDYLDDAYCAEPRTEQRNVEKTFKRLLSGIRPALDEIPAEERPDTFERYVTMIEAHPQLRRKYYGSGVYQNVSGVDLTEPEVKDFLRQCPPFHASCLAQEMGFYSWSLRGRPGPKDQIGRASCRERV